VLYLEDGWCVLSVWMLLALASSKSPKGRILMLGGEPRRCGEVYWRGQEG